MNDDTHLEAQSLSVRNLLIVHLFRTTILISSMGCDCGSKKLKALPGLFDSRTGAGGRRTEFRIQNLRRGSTTTLVLHGAGEEQVSCDHRRGKRSSSRAAVVMPGFLHAKSSRNNVVVLVALWWSSSF
jgi:hypothetical protein